MNIDKSICPVPQQQRPINEYLSLKESFGFSWTTENEKIFYTTSLKIYCGVLILFILTFNNTTTSPINIITYSILSVTSILFIFYLRIYLGWNYVYTRLMQATVAYEESGWYDGQIWVKTPEILIKDKLAGQYQVKPILNKITNILSIFLFFIITSFYLIYFSNTI
jgi:hypothetical protein